MNNLNKTYIKGMYGGLILLLWACSAPLLWAQQEPYFSLYRYQFNRQNPAAVGLVHGLQAQLHLRSQWLGIDGAPESQGLSINAPNNNSRLHLGFSLFNEKTFVEQHTQLLVDFAYALPLGNNNTLFLGLKAGATSLNVQAAGLATFDPTQDPLLINRSGFVPNLGVGLFYRSQNFYFSAAVPRLLNTERFSVEEGQVALATDRPHFYLSTARRFQLNSSWSFTPHFLLAAVEGAPTTVQFDFLFALKNSLELGPLYQKNQGWGGSFSLQLLEKYRLSYAYTAGGRFPAVPQGSHELGLRFQLGGTTAPKSNPLFASPLTEKEPTETAND